MGNSQLEQALARAVTVLATAPEKEIQQLSVLDCTFMLKSLPNVDSLIAMRTMLATRLQKLVDGPWIEHGDASEVYSVLGALWKYDPASVKSDWLAGAIQRLVRSEAAVGGPYYAGATIAVAANAQIASFIRLVAQPLPNMNRFFADIIATERFEDTEFTCFGLLYLLTTACDCKGLTHYAEGNWLQNADWQTPWHQVVALAILKETVQRPKIRQALLTISQQQQADGTWIGEPLTKNTPSSRFSCLVTTALVTEALCTYLYMPAEISPAYWRRKRQVAQAAAQLFKVHPRPLRSLALTAIKRVCKADENFEITLLPHFFAHALDSQQRPTSAHCTNLGLANLCTWIAYTIYDDFIDSEGAPAELPVANVAMRASLDCFRAVLPEDVHFQRYVAQVFAGMDEANAWELTNCRFAVHGGSVTITELPKYGRCTVLATRAFAHALTPMAILAQHTPCSVKQSRHIETAFQHYLIARQLNDDLHDWVKDMQVGQASYVVTAILRDMRIDNEVYDLGVLLPAMQKCFRRTTLPKVCQRLLWHITLSRQQFAKSRLLQKQNDIYLLLDNLEQSAQQSLDKHAKCQTLADIH